MLLNFKINLLLINALFFLGYASILHADECGVLRYLANKSNGVTVSGNTCDMVDDIALDSEFSLSSGARLWFKSSGAEAKMQVICQNRSSKSIHINVDSNKQPWIKPSDLDSCSSWANNKMSCEESAGGSNALSCVMAAIDSESSPKKPEERTTSIKMRSLLMIDKTKPKSAETQKEQIISAMQPDVKLCRAISYIDAPIKMTWLVETNGRVNTVTPATDGSGAPNDADKPFIDCLTAVIKDFSYPQSFQAVWLYSQF